MKKLLIPIVVVLSLFSGLLQAQNRLAESTRASAKSYIYTVDKDYLREIHLKDETITEDMLGKCVADYIVKTEKRPTLPPGNYVIVNAVGNQLNFVDHTVDDLYFKIVPSEEVMLCLYDSLGNYIKDAEVKAGSKRLKYNKDTQTYNTKSIKDGTILEVNNHGVYHYIEIEKQNNYNRYHASRKNVFTTTWRKMKRWWSGIQQGMEYLFYPDDRPTKYKYTGFVTFSKPKYKPGETVKLKGYIADIQGNLYKKPVGVRLHGGYYPFYIDTVLTNLKPYRPGMYEYEFKLTDSLDLKLDSYYSIELKTAKERRNDIKGGFRYEDYELKGLKLSMQTNKSEYTKGDSIKIKLKVTDENDMAVYGGRIHMQAISQSINYDTRGHLSAFVPDVLWADTLDMGEKSEHEIVLPDSIFPQGVSFHYQVMCEFLSADNEKRTESKRLYRNAEDYVFNFSLDKGALTIKELCKGQSQSVMAYLETCGANGEVMYADSVLLPHTLVVPWIATDVTVKTKHGKSFYSLEKMQHQLSYRFYHQNDSIYLTVDNPAGIPFWYNVRKNKKEIAKGYTTSLNYSAKGKNDDGYAMQISYLFGEDVKHITEELPFARKNMSMEVSTPTVVYPGQKADVVISVTDKKGKPVNDVDITAYSFTSKFGYQSLPNIAVPGKANYAKRFNPTMYEPEENGIHYKRTMNWERWKNTMTLDTVEYYKFLYPETYYKYAEDNPEGSTLLSPYLVVDGALQGVNMLWIDGRLYYSNLAEQLENYIFPVEPGRHNLRFRTYNREVYVSNVMLEKATKNILSFNVAKSSQWTNNSDGSYTTVNSKEFKKNEVWKLSKDEIRSLTDQLITIDNNFGWIHLPNLSNPIDVPAYIVSGRTVYYLNPIPRRKYDYRLNGYVNQSVLAGPFPLRNYMNGMADVASVYADGKLVNHIGIEGGNHYTVYPGYQKTKNWPDWKINTLNNYTPNVNFDQQLLTGDLVQKHFTQRVLNTLSISTGYAEDKYEPYEQRGSKCRLNLQVGKDKAGKVVKPALIFIVPEKAEDIGLYQLYYGATRHFTELPEGRMKISLVLNDSVSCTKTVNLKPNGQYYLKFDSVLYDSGKDMAQAAFRIFNRNVKKELTRNPYENAQQKDTVVSVPVQLEKMYMVDGPGNVVKGKVCDSQGEPIIGASVMIKGTTSGAVTDIDGNFELATVSGKNELMITFIGYQVKTLKYTPGYAYNIVLKEGYQALEEVVVVGYGTQKKTALAGSVAGLRVTENSRGDMSNFFIRGSSSISSESSPLILVNGVPYSGTLDGFDPNLITSINILKDSSATAIYGSRAASGVIMISTDGPITLKSTKESTESAEEFPVMESANTMRRNFHDDAFWQPRLRTNKSGEASFQVTYPDDITSWEAYFVAVGGKKQADKKQMTIRSFKALTARLSTPRFAVRGDSLNAVGRIANHYGDSISVTRKINADESKEDQLDIFNSYVDHIPVKANEGDSLTVSYSLQMPNGYFDGEERSLPIFERGMLQTHGGFKVINDEDTHSFDVNPGSGTVTVHMEASSLDLFLREIEKVDIYPYMCNEQMASKIKALLSKKRIAALFKKEFKEDKKINSLISRLMKNRNQHGLWGWWNVSGTEQWISRHVISALLDAEKAGYETKLNVSDLSYALEQELRDALNKLEYAIPGSMPYAKNELLQRLINLKRMNASIDYEGYFRQINDRAKDDNLTNKLNTMYAMAVIGLKDEINMDSLMSYSGKTMLGSMYWGDKEKDRPLYRHFMLPHGNNIDYTLMAYNILKEMGGHESELESIRNYFFERRNGGSWRNTYESSRIVETIMPDMLEGSQKFAETVAYLNDTKITQFPYTIQLDAQSPVHIKKQGTLPLFATVYQQNWNPDPLPESEKGFKVKSVFAESDHTVSHLTAGKVTRLEVTVTVDAEAEYVQIEVPIPAGCSYETKQRGSYWKEIHREHFKEKVVIFSNKLPKGEHQFTIELIPRYTGRYTLNPAKAELMYFPTFYGNERLKTVEIE